MAMHGLVTIQVGQKGQPPVSRLVLPLGLEEEQLSNDIRVSVIQTTGGAYFDSYGTGIPTLTLSGTTGLDTHVGRGSFNGAPCSGFQAMKHLDQDVVDKFFALQRGASVPGSNGPSVAMKIVSETDREVWNVIPTQPLQISRSNQRPLWYMFTLPLSVIAAEASDLATPAHKTPDPAMAAFADPGKRAALAMRKITAAAAMATSVAQTPPRYYIVQSGDTLWAIAGKYLPTGASNATVEEAVDKLVAANHVANPNLIFPGQRLVIPNPLP